MKLSDAVGYLAIGVGGGLIAAASVSGLFNILSSDVPWEMKAVFGGIACAFVGVVAACVIESWEKRR